MQPLSPVLEKSIVNACIEQPLQKSQESTEQPAPFVEEAVKRATTKGKAGRKRTVKRSTISASSSAAAALDPAATLPPIVKKMNAPIALKSSKEPGTRLKSFGVSERAINQLKIIWSHSSVTGEFGVFENVIFHLYTSLAKLQKHLEAELKIDTLTSSLKALVPQFHFNLYEVLINVHLKLLHEDDEIQEIGKERLIFQDIPLVIDALVESIGKIDNTFSQRETKSTLIQRLGNLRQRERLAGNILTPIRSTLDELNITLPVLRELSSLPPASLHALSLPLSYMFQDFPELKEEPLNESQNRLTAYADCMATLIEQAAKRGFSGVISMPNSLYRLFLTDAAALSGISFKDESKAFTLLGDAELAINEMEQLQKQTSLLYCKAASGLLTYRQFVEECHVAVVKEKTQKEFTAMLLNGFLTWSVMIDNLAFIYNCSATLISKNNPLLIEEEMLAKIACCWHEVSAQRDNKNHQLLAGTAHVAKEQIAANISHELLIDLIDGYLKDVIAVYKQFGTILTKEIMDDLESFLDREHPMQWQKLHHLRKVLHPLQAIVHDFRSKSFLFNKNMRLEYEKLLHQHEISFQEASFLRGILMQLKCDISDIISPPPGVTGAVFKSHRLESVTKKQQRQCERIP